MVMRKVRRERRPRSRREDDSVGVLMGEGGEENY